METIGKYAAKWGEGPVWHEGKLFYVDIEGHRICSMDVKTGVEAFCEIGERVGFVIPRHQGGFVIGGDSGLHFLDTDSGKKTAIVDPEPEKEANRFNDGKCDPAGRLWAGTISTIKKTGDAALYCLDQNLTLSMSFPNVTNSNGLCWSSDNSTFYYIDTPSKTIRAFDYDLESGAISGERVAVDTSIWEGGPDGMSIDANDQLWVAFCRGSCVRCIDPSSGAELERLELPVTGATSCAFGGEEFDTLYITTGKFANVEEELAGRVFAVKPGVKGRAAIPFAG